MMMSPSLHSLAMAAMVVSVISPEGSITQKMRSPAGMALATASSELALAAPASPSLDTASAFLSKPTRSWPPRIRRVAMLEPIRPRPIMASFMRKLRT